MKKGWGLIPKILNGEKVVESRWYLHRVLPWGKIRPGDRVYFKNGGEPVVAAATVLKVLQFEGLGQKRVKELLQEFGKEDGIEDKDIPAFFERFKDKKYCLFIYLKEVRAVKPFNVSKKGFGAMAAWMTIPRISQIRT